jgi:phosphopantetheinyl transferase
MSSIPWVTELPSVLGVQLWYSRLEQPSDVYRQCKSVLSTAELARLDTIGNPAVADGFVVRRGTVRHLLGGLLEIPPPRIEILNGTKGKPYVVGGCCDFSVSSAEVLALYGCSTSRQVGVDVEWIDRGLEHAAPLDWCQTEAMAKALGVGLSVEIERLDMSGLEVGDVLGLPPGYCGAVAVGGVVE